MFTVNRRSADLPKFSSSYFASDSWVPDRKHDSSSDIAHIPIMAEGDTQSTYTTAKKYIYVQKLEKKIKLPLSFYFFCRTRGKTCSGDSTSSPCFHQTAALLVRGKSGGKAHSTLGNAASAKINISKLGSGLSTQRQCMVWSFLTYKAHQNISCTSN